MSYITRRQIEEYLQDLPKEGEPPFVCLLKPECGGVDLRGLDLSPFIFYQADFADAMLDRECITSLIKTTRNYGLSFKGACLNQAKLNGHILKRPDIGLAKVIYFNLSYLNFEKAKLIQADLRRSNLRGANLKGANLMNANLQGADLREANFAKATLTGANFSHTQVEGTIFEGAIV